MQLLIIRLPCRVQGECATRCLYHILLMRSLLASTDVNRGEDGVDRSYPRSLERSSAAQLS